MITGTKLTASAIKELAKLNADVADEVTALMKRYGTRRVKFYRQSAGYRQYMAEATDYTFYAPNGQTLHGDMVSESTVGCANTGINYAVNQHTPNLPEGTWIVASFRFMGTPYIEVHYVGNAALPIH